MQSEPLLAWKGRSLEPAHAPSHPFPHVFDPSCCPQLASPQPLCWPFHYPAALCSSQPSPTALPKFSPLMWTPRTLLTCELQPCG